jgi:hypothetical protein
MHSYKIVKLPATEQDPNRRSFQGGSPVMPSEIESPRCKLCDAELTFFFQVEFPTKTAWAGRTLCMFACTTCQDLEYGLPRRPPGYTVEKVVIPDGYIEEYQIDFRTLVFENTQVAVPRSDIVARFDHQPFEFQRLTDNNKSYESKIGGRPYGLYESEVPLSYMGSAMTFLMQLEYEWVFKVREGMPLVPGFGGLPDQEGALFWGLPTYFSGTIDLQPPKVWVLTFR